MERESNPMQALCRSGCGFYGNPATDGLCSLCYKEALKKKQQPPVSVSAPSSSAAVSNAQSLVSLMDATSTAQPTIPTCLSNISTSELTEAIEEDISGSSNIADTSTSADLQSSSDEKDGDKDSKKKKNRCVVCRKKVGLTEQHWMFQDFNVGVEVYFVEFIDTVINTIAPLIIGKWEHKKFDVIIL